MNNQVGYLVNHVVTTPKIAGTFLVIWNSQKYVFHWPAPRSVAGNFILKHGLHKFSFQLSLSPYGSTVTALAVPLVPAQKTKIYMKITSQMNAL